MFQPDALNRSQQLSFKCSLLRRSIERGRLFGGGRKAVEEAVAHPALKMSGERYRKA